MVKIDTSSFIPFYEQVKTQIKKEISIGNLGPDDPLPSIRDLATRLVINPNTVARAYRELEMEGFISTRKGKGCFVSDNSSKLIEKERNMILNQIFDRTIEEARRFYLDAEEIKRLFQQRLERARTTEAGGKKNE